MNYNGRFQPGTQFKFGVGFIENICSGNYRHPISSCLTFCDFGQYQYFPLNNLVNDLADARTRIYFQIEKRLPPSELAGRIRRNGYSYASAAFWQNHRRTCWRHVQTRPIGANGTAQIAIKSRGTEIWAYLHPCPIFGHVEFGWRIPVPIFDPPSEGFALFNGKGGSVAHLIIKLHPSDPRSGNRD